MLDAGRHRLEAGGFGAADRFRRQGRRGNVDVGDLLADQRVAHRPAGHTRLLTTLLQRGKQLLQMLFAEPVGPARKGHLGVHA